MTTSGVATADFSTATIVELAGRKAGWEVEELTAGHATLARQLLTTILNEWSSLDLFPWAADRRTLTLTAGVHTYSLPTDVVDLMTGATTTSLATSSQSPSTSHIIPVSREDFASISTGINDDTMRERPTQYWLWRKAVPTLFVFPVPDKTYTFTYWCIRRLHDVTAALETTDAPMRWMTAIVDRLALELFDSMPAKRRTELMPLRPSLQERALVAEQKIKTGEVEQGSWFVFG